MVHYPIIELSSSSPSQDDASGGPVPPTGPPTFFIRAGIVAMQERQAAAESCGGRTN